MLGEAISKGMQNNNALAYLVVDPSTSLKVGDN